MQGSGNTLKLVLVHSNKLTVPVHTLLSMAFHVLLPIIYLLELFVSQRMIQNGRMNIRAIKITSYAHLRRWH